MMEKDKKKPAPVETEQVKRFVAERLSEYCFKPGETVRPPKLSDLYGHRHAKN